MPLDRGVALRSNDQVQPTGETPASESATDDTEMIANCFFVAAALRCHGLSTVWITTGAVLLPSPSAWTPGWSVVAWLIDWAPRRFAVAFPPLDPPPRSLIS
ncbi:MAG TPA: hypothetical protein VNK04_08590 [Gemmataceae bacterium]|nr:hypothetical protein [Gemmataceae bacterium]